MSPEETDAELERVGRECRDAEEHLKQLLVNLERDAVLLGELSGRMDRQKNTVPIDWSEAYDKVMVEAGKSTEAIDLTPYRAVLDVEALHTLQTEIATARARLFALRRQQSEGETRYSASTTTGAAMPAPRIEPKSTSLT